MNKYLLQLADMPWSKVLVVGLVLGALYYFLVRDDGAWLQSNLEQSKQQLAEAEQQLKVTRKAMENADRFEQEVKAAKKQFERVTDFMPLKMSTADLTTLMSEKSSTAGVRLLSTSPIPNQGSNADKPLFFDAVRVAFKIEGAFSQILAFLSLISKDTRMLTFENTDLTTLQGSPVDSPTLTFSGELVGYRYKKEAAAAVMNGQPAEGAQPNAGGANAQ